MLVSSICGRCVTTDLGCGEGIIASGGLALAKWRKIQHKKRYTVDGLTSLAAPAAKLEVGLSARASKLAPDVRRLDIIETGDEACVAAKKCVIAKPPQQHMSRNHLERLRGQQK